jgi:hypothetical protein
MKHIYLTLYVGNRTEDKACASLNFQPAFEYRESVANASDI